MTTTSRARFPALGCAARLVAVVVVASAAVPTGAQVSQCASAEDALRARAKPVCTPAQALSPSEALACAEHARLATIVQDCWHAAVRDDRRRLERYPDEATHRKAEAAELAVVLVKLRTPNARLAELLAKRKALDGEAEFYKGKPLPRELQREVDASDASLQALRDVFRGLDGEVVGIVERYADERTHLRKLWGGAAPGSIGAFEPRSGSSRGARGNAPTGT